jgi:predicted esterase
VDIADQLAGKLLLIHGEMDDQVHPDHTLRLADRLIAADKDFELLNVCPGPSTRSSTAWPTSASAAGTFWCAN